METNDDDNSTQPDTNETKDDNNSNETEMPVYPWPPPHYNQAPRLSMKPDDPEWVGPIPWIVSGFLLIACGGWGLYLSFPGEAPTAAEAEIGTELINDNAGVVP